MVYILASEFDDNIEADNEANGLADDDTVIGGNGNDTIVSVTGNDSLDGGNGNDSLSGGNGNDTVSAGYGNDTLAGNDGNDLLLGYFGNDTLTGGIGNDTLDGGNGVDKLIGGEGEDTFYFRFSKDSGTTGATRDSILDFEQGIDTIAIHRAIGEHFIGASTFGGHAREVRYEQIHSNDTGFDHTIIQVDRNGDAVSDFEILISRQHVDLTEVDFDFFS